MKISIVGLNDYIKDGVVKGVTVYGNVVDDDNFPNSGGCRVFEKYFSGAHAHDFELDQIFEVLFEHYKTKDGYAARVVGLRKEDE